MLWLRLHHGGPPATEALRLASRRRLSGNPIACLLACPSRLLCGFWLVFTAVFAAIHCRFFCYWPPPPYLKLQHIRCYGKGEVGRSAAPTASEKRGTCRRRHILWYRQTIRPHVFFPWHFIWGFLKSNTRLVWYPKTRAHCFLAFLESQLGISVLTARGVTAWLFAYLEKQRDIGDMTQDFVLFSTHRRE